MEVLFEYVLFLAKVVTLVAALIVIVMIVAGFNHRHHEEEGGHIEVKNVNEAIDNLSLNLKHLVLNPEQRKLEQKEEKKRQKSGPTVRYGKKLGQNQHPRRRQASTQKRRPGRPRKKPRK